MRSLQLLIGFALATAPLVAEFQKPNLSGTWVQVSPAEGAGQEETIRQDDKSLTRGHPSEGGSHTSVIKLDGTVSRNVLTSHGEDIVTVSNATWDGDRLVITSDTTYSDKRRLKTKEVLWIDGEGRLNVEFSETMDGGEPRTVKAVFRKKT